VTFRFVHAADLHLDSPFKGLGAADAGTGRQLQRATFEAFDNIVNLCLGERVDALVIAGDVYDGADRSLVAQLKFQSGLTRLADAGIRSFIAHGNHDPLDGWQASLIFPDLVHRFSPAVETVSIIGTGQRVAVHGYSYRQRVVLENVAATFRADPSADLNIAVLHGTVGRQPGHDPYAPCSLADLTGAGMDYWAMGHVHERQVLRDAHPAVVYPGNPQGRHLKERGERGVYLVTMEPGAAPQLDFRAVDVARWERITLPIDDMSGEQDLLNALLAEGARLGAAGDGRLVLAAAVTSGAGPLHGSLRRPGVASDLVNYANTEFSGRGQRVYITAIEDRTMPESWADESGSGGFVAEVQRAAELLRLDPATDVELALADLFDQPAFRFLEAPGGDVKELIDRALVLATDGLREASL
jgi:DNA repair exonuclease SbcCD nuclease subunit